jgi:hypothetical protein
MERKQNNFQGRRQAHGQRRGNGLKIELIPQSESHYLAPGWVLPLTFVKDKDGHTIALVEDSDEGGIYKKIK